MAQKPPASRYRFHEIPYPALRRDYATQYRIAARLLAEDGREAQKLFTEMKTRTTFSTGRFDMGMRYLYVGLSATLGMTTWNMIMGIQNWKHYLLAGLVGPLGGWALGKRRKLDSHMFRVPMRIGLNLFPGIPNNALHEGIHYIQMRKMLPTEHIRGGKEGLSTAAETLLARQRHQPLRIVDYRQGIYGKGFMLGQDAHALGQRLGSKDAAWMFLRRIGFGETEEDAMKVVEETYRAGNRGRKRGKRIR